MPNWWRSYIAQGSRQRGLDPQAVLAIAAVEGLSGRPGDNNSSFGPFQLHRGGALPAGRGRAWAESQAGINYALDRIRAVAAGKRGGNAISAISSRFERPADVPGEIRKAMALYGHTGASGGMPGGLGAKPSPILPGISGTGSNNRAALTAYLSANLSSFAATGKVSATAPAAFIQALQQVQTKSDPLTKEGLTPHAGPVNTGQGGVTNFGGKPVASWIAQVLTRAKAAGWTGSVNSGYRSVAEQRRIYNSGVRPAARPGQSNHNFTAYPGGAVDVSQAAQLAHILRRLGINKLVWAGAKDPVHFSHPHNGGY